MANHRSAEFWSADKETFARALVESVSVQEALGRLGTRTIAGGHYVSLGRRAQEHGLGEEFQELCQRGTGSGIQQWIQDNKTPLEEILVVASPYTNRGRLKTRLLAAGLLENKCRVCGMPPEWKGQPLVLVLDHINGVHNDNRLDNLRLLCPNCNSQTDTFSGRNRARKTGESSNGKT